MFSRRRILYLGSISILLLSGLLFVAHTQLTPTAHATSCDTVAEGVQVVDNIDEPYWHYNCGVSQTENTPSNFVKAIQEIVNAYLGTNKKCDTPLTVDGVFGTLTQTAVGCFQANEGQGYTGGVVGSPTWDDLADAVGSFACFTCDQNSPDWQYFSAYGTTDADFRVFIDPNDPTYVWYVRPVGTGTWCQMNTGDSC
jgi:Putative peptidoglycan binding domain